MSYRAIFEYFFYVNISIKRDLNSENVKLVGYKKKIFVYMF